MKILALVITTKIFWNFCFGIIAPSGISSNLIKSGGFLKSSFTLEPLWPISTGIEASLTSFVLSGTGNSGLKALTISPFLVVKPIPSTEAVRLMSNILFSQFFLENPSRQFSFHGLGYGLGAEIRIISSPLKSSVFLEYNSYPSNHSRFSWFNLGIRLGI